MAALSVKQLSQKLGAIAESWTKDPFRPNLQLQTFLKSLASHPRLTVQAVEATRALRDNDMQKKVCLLSQTHWFQIFITVLVSAFTKDVAPSFCPPALRAIGRGF
jgi:hypothetical protein